MDTETEPQPRLFRAKAVLAYLDSPVYDLTYTAFKMISPPVPVYSEYRIRLGFASVYVEANKLLADLSIDYSCEERLLIETKSETLYPRIVGQLKTTAFSYIDLGRPEMVRELLVERIVLSRQAPLDSRLVGVGEPVL